MIASLVEARPCVAGGYDRSMHPAGMSIDELLKHCEVTRGRRSGPGGQHRNKVETAVTIAHRPTGVTGQAGERREQAQNHRAAVFRLRVSLAVQVREAVDLRDMPSAMWRGRVRDGRIALNPGHDDFPAMLAEALDVLAACDGDMARAARLLDCTASQLVKLLRHEPRALAAVNAGRLGRGDRALK